MRAVLVLDTNVLLHAKSVRLIDWLGAAQTLNAAVAEVVLAIPPVVLDELDKHKSGHAAEGLRNRAQKAIDRIAALFETAPGADANVPQRPGVKLRLLRNRRVSDGGDSRFGDDQLLGALHEAEESEPSAVVALVSRDEGLRLRSRQRGHQVLALSKEDWRTGGPSIHRGANFEVSEVRFDEVLLSSDDVNFLQKTIVKPLNTYDARFGEARARRGVLLQTEYVKANPHLARMTAGTDVLVEDRLDREQAYALEKARGRRDGSLSFNITFIAQNTGGVRLTDVEVDPLEIQIGGIEVEAAAIDAYVGRSPVSPVKLGFNPTQQLRIICAGTIPKSLTEAGTYGLRIRCAVVTSAMAWTEVFVAQLALRFEEPEIRWHG